MVAFVIILIFTALLYIAEYIEHNDPIYRNMCHDTHPKLHILLAPIALIKRLLLFLTGK